MTENKRISLTTRFIKLSEGLRKKYNLKMKAIFSYSLSKGYMKLLVMGLY